MIIIYPKKTGKDYVPPGSQEWRETLWLANAVCSLPYAKNELVKKVSEATGLAQKSVPRFLFRNMNPDSPITDIMGYPPSLRQGCIKLLMDYGQFGAEEAVITYAREIYQTQEQAKIPKSYPKKGRDISLDGIISQILQTGISEEFVNVAMLKTLTTKGELPEEEKRKRLDFLYYLASNKGKYLSNEDLQIYEQNNGLESGDTRKLVSKFRELGIIPDGKNGITIDSACFSDNPF